jgi:hypothetical protein
MPTTRFTLHFDNVNAGDERRVQLSYKLKRKYRSPMPRMTGYSRLLFRNKNYFSGRTHSCVKNNDYPTHIGGNGQVASQYCTTLFNTQKT